MEFNYQRFDVAAIKRTVEKEWTLFDNVTVDEIAIAMPAGHFDYAVIYDKKKKKIGYWNPEKGIVFHPPKKKKKKKSKKP